MTFTASHQVAKVSTDPAGFEHAEFESYVTTFEEHGFVVVPDLVSHSELDQVAPKVSAAVEARRAGDTRTLIEKSTYEQSFVQCVNLWEDSPGVRPLTFHPRIAAMAARLLRADVVRLWHDQALFKEAGGRLTDPHQDQPYWPIAEPRTVTAWIPLDGATLQSGCLGYIPGSHRAGICKFVNIFRGEPEDLLAEPALSGREPEFREVPRGAVAFHHGLTAHLAGPNRTSQMRRVHTVIYFADGCTRSQSAVRHLCVDRPAIAVGAKIDSALTPIVHPPAGYGFPEPPAF